MPTPKSKTSSGASAVISPSANNGSNPEREAVFEAFREWGYLEGDLDPLGFLRPRVVPALRVESPYAAEARAVYSSTIGLEINHIYAPEKRQWIYERMEAEPQPGAGNGERNKDQQRIL